MKAQEPVTIGNVRIPNRFLRSATMENMADGEGFATQEIVRLYDMISRGGAGLIITGAAAVDPVGKVWKNQLCVWSDDHVEPLGRVAAAIHERGESKCAVQLHHGGSAGFGYSYGAGNGAFDVNTASAAKIRDVIAAFGLAAARVVAAGFDAVAVHGAHGYLISQFLSPSINRRDDEWGGSLENRARFAVEVCRALRSAVGDGVPILWKHNCSDFLEGTDDREDYARAAAMLLEAGADLIEVSGGVKEQIKLRHELAKNAGDREAYFGDALQRYRSVVGDKALAVTGGIRSRAAVERVLDAGADMAGISRPIIREPDFPDKILNDPDYERSRCISCNKCLLRIAEHPLGCVYAEG